MSENKKKKVVFDAFPDSPLRYLDCDAIVCIDVIRATTTLVTAVAQDRRAFPATSVKEAYAISTRLDNPLLAGEHEGTSPHYFEMQHSPALLARRTDVARPLVLVSSGGTELILNARGSPRVLLACFRNPSATARVLAEGYRKVALLATCSRGQLRCEDQMAAAWIADRLLAEGFEPADVRTDDLVRRWAGADVSLARWGNSADYLRRTGQHEDLEFILSRVDDLDEACCFEDGEVKRFAGTAAAPLRHQASWPRRVPASIAWSQEALPAAAAVEPRHAEPAAEAVSLRVKTRRRLAEFMT